MKIYLAAMIILIGVGVAESQKRAGTYELHPNQTVVITDGDRAIKFDIGAASGDDEFTLRGTAKLAGRNIYVYRTVIKGKIDDSVCRIRFTFTGRYVIVKEDLECTNYRFPIVSLDGRYEKIAP